MNLTYIARINSEAPRSIMFDDEEWKILYGVANKTKNASQKPCSIMNAATYLGQLGGPKRAPSDGPPELKIIWTGLVALHILISYGKFLT